MARTFAGCELEIVQGVPVLWRRDPRFFGFRFVLAWQRGAGGDQAARALLPSLLFQGTATHPDRPALARALERLYGAWAGPGTGRVGESTVFRLAAEAPAGAFLPGKPDQFGAALALLGDFAGASLLANGALPPAVFAREREQAVAAARAVADDRGALARQRALELGCAGEPYAVPEHGGEAAIAALAPPACAAVLRDLLQRGRPFALAMGALPDDLPARLQPFLAGLPPAAPADLVPAVQPAPRPVRSARERVRLQQSRLVLLWRFPVPTDTRALVALQVGASLLGGGMHSRLFREVRERRSLCYAIGAGADPHKGLLLVGAGADAASLPAIAAEVVHQRDLLARGEFTADELATAIAVLAGPLQAIDDTLAGRMQFTAEQWLLGHDETPADRLAALRATTAEAVAAAVAGLWFDFDYALVPEDAP